MFSLLEYKPYYYPEVIHPDPQWRARLDEIQDAHLHQTEKGTLRPRDGFRVHRPISRSTRNRIIPVVHTSYVAEEIENVASFVKNLDKLELPNQLVAVLADPLLQKLMLLRPDGESEQRLANWLNGVLQDVRDGDADENTFFDMLDILREYVVSIKGQNLPPLLLDFFARFLPLWDGSGRRDAMFEILSYSPLLDFKAATLDNTPESLLALLALYKNLLHHWTIVLESSDTVPDHASGTITALVRHVNPLALTLCQTCPSVSSRSAILDFYEQNARLVSHQVLKHYICIELPPSSLIYILFFSSSVAIVSRMCAILAFYKKGFEMAMLTRPGREKSNRIDSTSYNRTFVSLFNGYLMDIISLLIVTLATPELAKQTMY
uniref:Uncharacterized protein n=1 Tax=Fusarium oxysporum (strain Fo5176) TaxID=660025 RepID=A0A0D2XCL1_FUSOF